MDRGIDMNIKTIRQFNTEDTVLVITSYPSYGKHLSHQQHFNAVGWHSEKTLLALSEHKKVVVLAEKIGKEKDLLINENLLVLRSWKKGDIFSILRLIPTILSQFNSVKSLFVEFEFNVFGGILPNLELLFILGLFRLAGKYITFEMHQVITDIKKLEKHINIKNPVVQMFFNYSLRLYYTLVGSISNEVIVFEEELRHRLSRFINPIKIHTLSLAVDHKKVSTQKIARAKLGLPQKKKIFMLFGFINGYKGMDKAITQFIAHAPKNSVLLVAGGENPYLIEDTKYQAFYKTITDLIATDKRIIHSGFVPDSEVSLYFAAADQLLLPYEVFMSASGPFSLALAHKTPVRMSDCLALYTESHDFTLSMNQAMLESKDLFFSLEDDGNMFKLQKNRKITRFVELIAEKRSMKQVIMHYVSILFPRNISYKIGFLHPALPVQ